MKCTNMCNIFVIIIYSLFRWCLWGRRCFRSDDDYTARDCCDGRQKIINPIINLLRQIVVHRIIYQYYIDSIFVTIPEKLYLRSSTVLFQRMGERSGCNALQDRFDADVVGDCDVRSPGKARNLPLHPR